MRFAGLTAVVMAGALTMVACSDDDDAGGIIVVDEWTEPAAQGDDAVVNLIVVSPGDDALIGAEVSSSVAEGAALQSPDGADLDSIAVPNEVAVFSKPDNDHIALIGLTSDLADGDRFELTLVFEEAGEQFVAVTVGDGPPFG